MTQFLKLDKSNFRNLSIRTYPEISFVSSTLGITGTKYLYPYTSSAEYVQVVDNEVSKYPSGNWWGKDSDSAGKLSTWFSGSTDINPSKIGQAEALQGNSIHNIDLMDSDEKYFIAKPNKSFNITRETPVLSCENENVLNDGDVYTWKNDSNNGYRVWEIDSNIALYSSDKWYENLSFGLDTDVTDFYNAVGSYPFDDGYVSNNSSFVVGEEKSIYSNKLLHKLCNSNNQKFDMVYNSLMPYYIVEMPTAENSFTNYSCFNFFTSSAVQSDTAFVYKSPQSIANNGSVESKELDFGVSSSFCIEFWLKPTGPQTDAGTILHYSGNYALSLITASSDSYQYDGDNRYKLMLQLSSSTNTAPSLAVVDFDQSENLVFTSSNYLKEKHWHHVAVRWDKNKNNVGSLARGDFIIDGNIDTNFYISKDVLSDEANNDEFCGLRSWLFSRYDSSNVELNDPLQLVLGNYFEGNIIGSFGGFNNAFFNTYASNDEGLSGMTDVLSKDPQNIIFNYPLNAELHEVRVWKDWRSIENIRNMSSCGLSNDIVSNASASGLKFYLPLLFVEQVSQQDKYKYTTNLYQEDITGDVTFDNVDTEIHPYPINVPLAMGVNAFEVNVQNFARDFARIQKNSNKSGMPRLYNLTASATELSDQELVQPANDLLESPKMLKRNLTVLPCDNGKFVPNWNLCSLLTASQSDDSNITYPFSTNYNDMYIKNYPIPTFANPKPNSPDVDYSSINLDKFYIARSNKLVYDNKYFNFIDELDSFASPKYPNNTSLYIVNDGLGSRPLYYIGEVLSSSRSQNCCLFDMSNIFYGNQTKRGSMLLIDSNITGSESVFNITLKDDGYGSLYRADAKTEHATFNNVGNVFYNEGVMLVKSPLLYNFGKDKFDIQFSGTVDINTRTV